MTPPAIILITISAFAHAFWNLLGKRRRPSMAFFLLANGVSAVALFPLLLWQRQSLAMIPMSVWLLLAATGFFQTIYFAGLANAYSQGDMSLAYPLARAMPVLLVAFVSLAIGRGYQIGRLGIAGMALVTAGCLILPLTRIRQFRLSDYLSIVYIFALTAAVGTTGYTLIDDQALRLLRTDAQLQMSDLEIALLYVALEAVSITVVSSVYTALAKKERLILAEIWRSSRAYAGVTGLIMTGTYGLVLASMAYVTNVSYVAAFRQLSIPLGALLGITVQGEPRHPPKLVGIAIVSAGLIMVGIG